MFKQLCENFKDPHLFFGGGGEFPKIALQIVPLTQENFFILQVQLYELRLSQASGQERFG